MNSTSTEAILFEFQRAILSDVAALNVQYLGISVAVILGSGIILTVLLYFLNFRPLLKKLDLQENSLEGMQQSLKQDKEFIDNSFSSLRSKLEDNEKKSEQKLIKLREEAANLIARVESKTQQMEIMEEWYQHYMWDSRDIADNVLDTLVECLALSLSYKKDIVNELALKELDDLFTKKSSEIEDNEALEKLEKLLPKLSAKYPKLVSKIDGHVAKLLKK